MSNQFKYWAAMFYSAIQLDGPLKPGLHPWDKPETPHKSALFTKGTGFLAFASTSEMKCWKPTVEINAIRRVFGLKEYLP